jgi:hypothetical protein
MHLPIWEKFNKNSMGGGTGNTTFTLLSSPRFVDPLNVAISFLKQPAILHHLAVVYFFLQNY